MSKSSAGLKRIERLEQHDGIRYRIVAEPRVRHPDKLLFRFRLASRLCRPGHPPLVRLDSEKEAMARRVLRRCARLAPLVNAAAPRWPRLSPFLVESELLDPLVRQAGMLVEDRYHNRQWVVHRFRVDESVRPWLGVVDPDEVRAELQRALTQSRLLAALAEGPPPRGMSWGSFGRLWTGACGCHGRSIQLPT